MNLSDLKGPTGRAWWEKKADEAWTDLGNPKANPTPSSPTQNDLEFDAFRHGYTNALWTRLLDEYAARAGGDYIERSNPNNFKSDRGARDMRGDLINNAKGREIAKSFPNDTNHQIAQKIYDAIKRGEFVVEKQTDPRTLQPNFPPDLNPRDWDDLLGEDLDRWVDEIKRDVRDTLEDLSDGVREIAKDVNDIFRKALGWLPPRDPLVLDLDSDGIEAVGINPSAPILFDHQGDGSKNATGWIKADDGLVVRDLNGNGTIDSGQELFGDNTLLTTGPNAGLAAAHGFAALADVDANGDGVVNSNDAVFSQLRVWQDANQDAISQPSELRTLSELDIASLNVQATPSNINLGNGNTQPYTGSFTRTNGSVGSSGVAEVTGSLLLASNEFYREFTDDPPLTLSAIVLPQMGGSGWVRDLREAMSLDIPQAVVLENVVTAFAAATTRDAQIALLNDLILAWSRTTDRPDIFTRLQINPADFHSEYSNSSSPNGAIFDFSVAEPDLFAKIAAMEQFNGAGIIERLVRTYDGGRSWVPSLNAWVASNPYYAIETHSTQLQNLNEAWNALTGSIYDGLVVQTRLRPYLDAIELVIVENDIHFDSTPIGTMLDAAKALDFRNALADLADLNVYLQGTLRAIAFDGLGRLRAEIDTLPIDSPLRTELVGWHVLTGGTQGTGHYEVYLGDATSNTFDAGAGNDVLEGGDGADTLAGGTGEDLLLGANGNDYLTGQQQDDQLFGNAGNDTLDGGDGNDVLEGEAGNDELSGGGGNNVYVFGRGDGIDHVTGSTDATPEKLNTLQLEEGILPSDLVLSQINIAGQAGTDLNSLVIAVANTSDKVIVNGYFYQNNPNSLSNPLQQIRFDDGTVWNQSQILASLFAGTTGADVLYGTIASDVIHGNAGNDEIQGKGGDNELFGDAGNDTLIGHIGNDTLEGGAADDLLHGDFGNNTYVFGRDDGVDHIAGFTDATAGKLNTLQFKQGVLPSDLVLSQINTAGQAGTDLNSLVITIAGTSDKVIVNSYFYQNNPDSPVNPLQQIKFDDGTVWNQSQILFNLFAGTAGADLLYGTIASDVIHGNVGNDEILGMSGDNSLFGDVGNDTLVGQTGNDTLEGGTGNDLLHGDSGNNTYVFGRGDGVDHINGFTDATAGKLNTLQFKQGVLPSDLALSQINEGVDLYALAIAIAGTSDKVIVNAFFYQSNPYSTVNPIQQIRFDDGTVWSLSQIVAKISGGTPGPDAIFGSSLDDVIFGIGGNDDLRGGGGNDLLDGGDGNDTLSGDTGNDTLEGGAGNDTANGGLGNNTYVFGRGDGQDTVTATVDATVGKLNTLQLKAGIVPTDLNLNQIWGTGVNNTGSRLEVSIAGTADKITVSSVFDQNSVTNSANGLQQIVFADGTVWDLATIVSRYFAGNATDDQIRGTNSNDVIHGAGGNDWILGLGGLDTLYGDAGNDTLGGDDGNDTLEGGIGNDALNGGLGNNTYVFGRGDGQDTVTATVDATVGKLNTLQLKAGVAPADLVLNQIWGTGVNNTGSRLEISIAGTADKITFNSVFDQNSVTNSANGLQQIVFADGTVWDLATIVSRYFAGNATDDQIRGTNSNDVIHGAGGNDWILGLGGNDIVYGDDGNDILSGDDGNDILEGGLGSDTVNGGFGNNIYLFGRGDGQDTVTATVDATVGKLNTLQLKAGVAPADLMLSQIWGTGVNNSGSKLEIAIAGTTDKITFNNVFDQNSVSNAANGLQQILFADGTVWDLAAIVSRYFAGNATDDQIRGTNSNDVIHGAGGNDVIVAVGGNDMVRGDEGNDNLNGDDGDDTLDGGAGSDSLSGGAGTDTASFLNAGSGVVAEIWRSNATNDGQGGLDTFSSIENLIGGSFDDLLAGNDAGNKLVGNAGSDQLTGNGGDDTLEGGAGNDSLAGGDGNDTFLVAGTDQGTDRFEGGNGIDELDGSVADDVFTLNVYSGTYTVERIDGKAGINSIVGTASDNTFDFSGTTLISIANIDGAAGNDSITGSLFTDVMIGGVGNDTLVGGASDDRYIFSDADGFDVVLDSAGSNDEIVFSAPLTAEHVKVTKDIVARIVLIQVLEPASETVVSTVTIELNAGSDASPIESVRFGDGSIWTIDNLINRQTYLTGSIDNDSLTGTSGENVIDGLSGNDTITGGSNKDILIGGTGGDVLSGGAGFDTYRYKAGDGTDHITDSGANRLELADIAFSQVSIASGSLILKFSSSDAIHLVNFDASAPTMGAGITEFVFADGIVRSLNDVLDVGFQLTGTASNNSLQGTNSKDSISGLAGHDTISGNDGNDVLIGGTGDDVLDGGAGADIFLVEGTAQGADRFTGGDGVDELRGGDGDDTFTVSIYSGTSTVEKIDGKGGVNRIAGNASNNMLDFSSTELVAIGSIDGGAGHDTITGSIRGDLIIGGTGDDVLDGGAGADVFLVEGTIQGADRFIGGDGVDELRGGDGDDTFTVSIYSGTSTVEKIDGKGGVNRIAGNASNNTLDFSSTELVGIASIDGGAGHDTITGSVQADVIIGGTGDDVLDGGAGADIFLVEGTAQGADRFTGGDGADELRGSDSDDTFTVSIFSGTATVERVDGKGGVNRIAGNASNNTLDFSNTELVSIASIGGGAGHDTIIGSVQGDVLIGGTGDDVLDGGAGADVFLVEGTIQGADRFIGGDGVDELRGGDGDDTFTVSIYSGTSTVEKIDGKGGVNRIAGNASNNTLDFSGTELVSIASIDGAAGHDAITGSAQDDVIIGGMGDDVLDGGAGADIFLVEGATQGADRFTGGDDVDELRGGDGDDTFTVSIYSGTSTVEKIDGKGGVNRIAGNSSNNTLDFSGTELVSIASIDGAAGHDTITGSASADYLIGGTGSDVLYGGDGNDTLEGGMSNDVMDGGLGADTFFFNVAPASNVDQIIGFNIAEDRVTLDRAVFTSLTATGVLTDSNLVAGAGVTAAADSDDYLIYNKTTGVLYYDADGNGAGAAQQIATLVGVPDITAANLYAV